MKRKGESRGNKLFGFDELQEAVVLHRSCITKVNEIQLVVCEIPKVRISVGESN